MIVTSLPSPNTKEITFPEVSTAVVICADTPGMSLKRLVIAAGGGRFVSRVTLYAEFFTGGAKATNSERGRRASRVATRASPVPLTRYPATTRNTLFSGMPPAPVVLGTRITTGTEVGVSTPPCTNGTTKLSWRHSVGAGACTERHTFSTLPVPAYVTWMVTVRVFSVSAGLSSALWALLCVGSSESGTSIRSDTASVGSANVPVVALAITAASFTRSFSIST
mmetsp:Transcript_15868/g.52081  ORF Transcript_15868/g.52081 Transcript_15868/m.52081 type:complete len:223 (+) Transcript_15868:618-1286(+)